MHFEVGSRISRVRLAFTLCLSLDWSMTTEGVIDLRLALGEVTFAFIIFLFLIVSYILAVCSIRWVARSIDRRLIIFFN